MITTNEFFDDHSDFYGKVQIQDYDNFFIDFIRKQNNNNKIFLDIGGGSGIFASFLKKNCNELDVFLMDPSLKMLEKNTDKTIVKFQGYFPDKLNNPNNKNFNYILLKEVLHHVTGKSIKETKALAIESLLNTKKIMADDGYLMIHELFYESYIYPQFSRTLIFYLLKFQEKFQVKFPFKEFLLGLSVCFYTRNDLEKFFKECGFIIIDSYEVDFPQNLQKKGLLLKKWGRTMYILKMEDKF